MGRLFRVKPLDSIIGEAARPEYRLRRALGPVQLTLLGIGAIIGAGIFATIGTAAAGDSNRPGAGPALILSFLITAVVCGFTALCYAEFASLVPIAGSAYTYSYASLGEMIAWIIGWDLIIEYAVGNVAVAISWANYFKTLLAGLGIRVPDWLSMDYRTAARIAHESGAQTVYQQAPHIFGVPIIFNLLAVAIVAAITIVLVWGIRESARFNAVIVAIKIIVLVFFIVVGLHYVQPANYLPFAPNGWAGISAGAAIVFFAYIGFDAVSTVAEETRNPQRNIPIGIIASLVICTVFYAVVAAVFTGLISYPELEAKLTSEQAEPLTMALTHASSHLGWAVGIVAFGSVIAHTAVLLVFQLGQPRIFFAMARDGLLPPVFSKVHARFHTPHFATILTGVFVSAFAAVASLDEMVDLTNIGTLFAFMLVCAGIIVLRFKQPGLARPFRVPSGWLWTVILYAAFFIGIELFPIPATVKILMLAVAAVIFAASRNHIFPVLGILSCLYLVYYLPPTSWLRFAAWLNFGFVIYVTYGSLHSRLTGRRVYAEASEGALSIGGAVEGTGNGERLAQHNAQTAYAGAWLAIIGTGLLILMRGLDLWLLALKHHAGMSELAKASAALHDIFQSAAWLEVSWFLIVPLALNAAVLCPVLIQRALRAKRELTADHGRGVTVASFGIPVALAIVSVAYLLLIVAHSYQ